MRRLSLRETCWRRRCRLSSGFCRLILSDDEVVGLAHVSGCVYGVLINLKLAVCSLSAKLSRALRVVFRANTQMIEPPGGGMVRRFSTSVGRRARLALLMLQAKKKQQRKCQKLLETLRYRVVGLLAGPLSWFPHVCSLFFLFFVNSF